MNQMEEILGNEYYKITKIILLLVIVQMYTVGQYKPRSLCVSVLVSKNTDLFRHFLLNDHGTVYL